MRLGWVFLVCGAALPGALRAQEAKEAIPVAPMLAQILRCPDFGQFDDANAPPKVKALERFVDVMRRLPIGDTAARSLTLTTARSSRGPRLLARGTKEQVQTVEAALAELERVATGKTRLQISLAMVPLAVARAHRLEPGKTVVADASAWAELMRDTVKADGSVHNPPEVIAGPLRPFDRQAAVPGDAQHERRLRVRGEVVPLAAGVVAVAVNVDQEVTPVDKRRPAAVTAVAAPVFRLAAGESAMMMAIDGTTAVVVIVRCLETGAEVK